MKPIKAFRKWISLWIERGEDYKHSKIDCFLP